ncbi:hypothetical protein Tco_0727907 [Tanacetum coccineum]|uniref:Uncharacterized protein n=1 Tax=Tanacetum coccineum TaxID=301880 RepID=A0ABQ4YKR5_9ASTR
MEVFREIFQICPRLPNQEFDDLSSDEEIFSFIKELGHKGNIKSITNVVVDQMHQPWRTFASIINKCLSGKITDFVFQIDNRDTKKQEKMYYPRFTKAIIYHLITKDKTISMRNRLFMHTAQHDSVLGTFRFVSKSKDFQVYGALLPEVMTNQKMRDSSAYKTYLAFTIGDATPKKARKFKKPASLSKKKAFVAVEEPADKLKKAPAKDERSKRIDLLLETALHEEAQLKKALKRSKRETNIHQAGGSSEGVDFESEGDSEDEDVDDQQSDDERTESDDEQTKTNNPKTSDDEEETQDNEYVHTTEDYVPTNDETNDESNDVNEEEYERISEELYGDVNVRWTDARPADKEKDDEEMTVADHTEVPLQSSSISSDYAAKFLNFDNIPPVDTEVISMLDINVQHEVPHTSSLLTIHVSIIPEKNVVNQSKTVTTTPAPTISSLLSSFYPALQQIASIPTLITTAATTSVTAVPKSETLVDALYKVLKKHDADIIKEFSIPKEIVERLTKQYLPQQRTEKSIKEIRKIKLEHKTALFKTMTKTKYFKKNPKYRALYHALMQSIIEDENVMEKGVVDQLKKRKPDDADKEEGPSAGLDRGLKRQKPSKDTEPSKKAKSTGTSKGTTKSQPKSTGKSTQAEETVLEAGDTQGPQNLIEDMGKSFENKLTQKWLSDLAKVEKPSKTFDDLMSTPIDFSAFVMDRIQISDLTQNILVGPAYNILKGTCRSFIELNYNMEECYKALTDQLDWNNPKGDRYPFDLSKTLTLCDNCALSSYACSDSLLLTPLCCDDIHDVTPCVSALAGCDRLVSEPLVIEK